MTLEAVAGADELRAVTRAMTDCVGHRGPDSEDYWVDAASGIALGHRRLAIIDLSDDGRQPMDSPSRRYKIVQNGEIYNYRELRAELEEGGEQFRTKSDTEVLLAAIDSWGVERALQKVDGMFAFALWDLEQRRLILARDRFGEKPLYYGWAEWKGTPTVYFASELSALRAHPGFSANVDRRALALYLRHSYIPAPYSIFETVAKVEPATFVVIDQHKPPRSERPVAFWSAIDTIQTARRELRRSRDTAVEELDTLLRRVVKSRVVSDVPLGAFLSGGVDSSVIVALMQAQQSDKVRTFSIGFFEREYDEAIDASRVASHLGTEHTDLYVTADEARAVIPELPHIYTEPFADSSQIPTYLVSRLARGRVTVSLSGDGGDELFGGYNRYQVLESLWPRLQRVPLGLRRRVGSIIDLLPAERTDRWLQNDRVSRLLPHVGRRTPGAKLRKFASILGEETLEASYLRLTSIWPDPTADLLCDVVEPPSTLTSTKLSLSEASEQAMALDTISYLPDDILAKVDRAAMAVALETRVPFLHPDVLSFAWTLPPDLRVSASGGKLILRQLLARYVPPELTDRPKMGFGVPLAAWLRGPLKVWGEELIRQATWLDRRRIMEEWTNHQSGRKDASHRLWAVLVACQWAEATNTVLD